MSRRTNALSVTTSEGRWLHVSSPSYRMKRSGRSSILSPCSVRKGFTTISQRICCELFASQTGTVLLLSCTALVPMKNNAPNLIGKSDSHCSQSGNVRLSAPSLSDFRRLPLPKGTRSTYPTVATFGAMTHNLSLNTDASLAALARRLRSAPVSLVRWASFDSGLPW